MFQAIICSLLIAISYNNMTAIPIAEYFLRDEKEVHDQILNYSKFVCSFNTLANLEDGLSTENIL